ncbi:adenosylcobinamide-phosphate synthase CbiB [Roseovarius amoyensis]|uniref:adenosylcobinamide-phosphate synthase CbiB n=1 Tax=Roseovarius amoyensis TaxID=2211448 RepID=UPI001EF7C621|nr:adenosylcobinamide-phosphate synthase CbiB [Roseovarius amoyensis]
MSAAAILALALVLDAVLGEPDWLWRRMPHPAVLMGRAVAWGEARLNSGDMRRARGVVMVTGLGIGALILGAVLQELGWAVEVVVLAVLLAHRSLVDHVGAVADSLRFSLGDARLMVARIVSRETGAMDGPAVSRAALESAAENFSDGVVAPAFWFLVGGLPGVVFYKLVNTADSMVGYRTPRYEAFGWAAARLDDLLNWVPARLSALMIAGLGGRLGDWPAITADARRHRSPNAGWPEAAAARVLGVALAGPRAYDGEMRAFPFVNPAGRGEIGADEIDAGVTLLWRVWMAALAVLAVAALLAG